MRRRFYLPLIVALAIVTSMTLCLMVLIPSMGQVGLAVPEPTTTQTFVAVWAIEVPGPTLDVPPSNSRPTSTAEPTISITTPLSPLPSPQTPSLEPTTTPPSFWGYLNQCSAEERIEMVVPYREYNSIDIYGTATTLLPDSAESGYLFYELEVRPLAAPDASEPRWQSLLHNEEPAHSERLGSWDYQDRHAFPPGKYAVRVRVVKKDYNAYSKNGCQIWIRIP